MSRARTLLVLPLAALLLAGCEEDPTAPAEDPVQQLVDRIRASTEAYHQVASAAAAGYAEASPCVSSPDGAMGFHYMNAPLVDAAVEPTVPELLLYEPTAGGNLRLVGVEYMVLAPEWDASNDEPPSLAGQPFDDHRAEEARHGIPFPHYDLHVWAWEENPNGTFAPFNPNVSCDGAG
jgi:hypothetical protein